MTNPFLFLQLYLILDDSLCAPTDMPEMLSKLMTTGITAVQLRMKHTSTSLFLDTALKVQKKLAGTIPFIINDAVDIAVDLNTEGVHLGQQDMSVIEARQLLGKEKIIGLSIENMQQATQCQHYPVDYFGVGPIFPTSTKKNAAPPLGRTGLAAIRAILKKPMVAIGGINSENAKEVLETGVSGIAVSSSVLAAETPVLAAATLNQIIQTYRS